MVRLGRAVGLERVAAEHLGVDKAFVAWREKRADARSMAGKLDDALAECQLADLYGVKVRPSLGGFRVSLEKHGKVVRKGKRGKTMPVPGYKCREPGCPMPSFTDGAKRLLHETTAHPDSPYRIYGCTITMAHETCDFRGYDRPSLVGHQRIHRGVSAEDKLKATVFYPVPGDGDTQETSGALPETPSPPPEPAAPLVPLAPVVIPLADINADGLFDREPEVLAKELMAVFTDYRQLREDNLGLQAQLGSVEAENIALRGQLKSFTSYAEIIRESAKELLAEAYPPHDDGESE
jgi:hypothetical protein